MSSEEAVTSTNSLECDETVEQLPVVEQELQMMVFGKEMKIQTSIGAAVDGHAPGHGPEDAMGEHTDCLQIVVVKTCVVKRTDAEAVAVVADPDCILTEQKAGQ